MAYEEGVNMNMPVAPAYGMGGNFGSLGGEGWWIILLFLAFGGWGGNGIGNGQNGLYPWLNQQDAIANGFSGVQLALSNGFAGVNSSMAQMQAFLSQQLSANEIAALERSFNAQTATMAGMNALQSQLAQCCYENRQATADLKYTLATEACASRAATAEAMQKILDTMCQDKIDAKNEKIVDLQSQLQMARLEASQNAQTAAILANNEAQTAILERYLAPVPIPAYIVANPNTGASGTT